MVFRDSLIIELWLKHQAVRSLAAAAGAMPPSRSRTWLNL